MGKKKKIEKNNDQTVKSINNGVRSSVRKLNPILKSIVGKKVDVAIRDLQFSEKRITRDIRKTNEYIRLRYNPKEKQGIFAHHINIGDGVNKEFEVEVGDIKTFKQILHDFGFLLLGTIDKKREIFEIDEFVVTIDEVKDIGNFLEIEVDGEEYEIEEKRNECKNFLKKLGLSEENICKDIWLCDIATGKTEWKK